MIFDIFDFQISELGTNEKKKRIACLKQLTPYINICKKNESKHNSVCFIKQINREKKV